MEDRRPGAAGYPHLFSPFRLGRLALPNRLVVPALATGLAGAEGDVTDALCRHLAARARGGFGLIVTEAMGVAPSGRTGPGMLLADKDRLVPGLARLAQAVHESGGRAVAQLSHAGGRARSRVTGTAPAAASAAPGRDGGEAVRALSLKEIQHYERRFVEAAVRAAVAGFDGIEIDAAHGNLVAGFLSAAANRRVDDYGGPLRNRMRFLLNVIRGIRNKLGGDLPLLVRISPGEAPGQEAGQSLGLAEAVEIGRALSQAGIDALSVSMGDARSADAAAPVPGEPEGAWLHIAGSIRQHLPLPVIGAGRIGGAAVAERAIEQGRMDLAAFGRASIADPELPRKLATARERDIIPCMGCNLCFGRAAQPRPVCPVNPALAREEPFDLAPAARPRRLLIHGGGFAALTAAWIAASRGHQVVLTAPEGEIGGLQDLRARVPGQAILRETATALRRRAETAGAIVVEHPPRPDTIDVTWAVRRFLPTLAPPTERLPVLSAIDVHAGRVQADVGRAVVFGDDLCAAEAALLLAERGIAVELRTPLPLIAVDAHARFRHVIGGALADRGAIVTLNAASPMGGSGRADVLVLGRDPAATLEDEGGWLAPSVLLAADGLLGDAYPPGLMARTVSEAARMALAL